MVARLLLLTAALAGAQDTRVILLGTGTPNPDPDRSGPAVAVVSGDRAYLVDAGPGVVRRAVKTGINLDQLTRVFVTHLHSDHTVGLPDVIFTTAVVGRHGALDIYGPPGIRAMTSHLMEAWKEDMEIRLHGLEPSIAAAYVVRAHDVKPGEIYRDDGMRVIAFAVNHGLWEHAYGYRFEAPDKTIVISGDTTYSPSLIAAAKGCDILVHEVYSQKGWEGRTPEWQKYHAAFHTSAPDLGRIAAAVKPKKLVLYHVLEMGETADEIVGEIHAAFKGEVIYGSDLQVIR
jgi:ribonuclease Z